MCLFKLKEVDLNSENPGATEGKFGFLGWEICGIAGDPGAFNPQIWGLCSDLSSWCL